MARRASAFIRARRSLARIGSMDVPSGEAIRRAIDSWKRQLGERVLSDTGTLMRYSTSTLESERRTVVAVLFPETAQEVSTIVSIAARERVPLYPISTGNNWGYGSSSPVVDGCAVVDLSHMRKITSFDAALGLVTIEPGVTTKQLRNFLLRRQAPFLPPLFGSGPRNSLLGNALDRGHSMTPHVDRFDTIMALEAVLADGTIYASSNGVDASHAYYKWGVGPYADGLFGQSNFGIVVRMVIKLAPRPEHMLSFVATVKDGAHLTESINRLRPLVAGLGSLMPAIRIYNPARALHPVLGYDEIDSDGLLSDRATAHALKQLSLGHWTVVGALYGPRRLTRAGRSIVRKSLRPSVDRLQFFDSRSLAWLDRAVQYAPFGSTRERTKKMRDLMRIWRRDMTGGFGYGVAARLPLWRMGRGVRLPGESLHTDYDAEVACGFMFFSAVFPFKGGPVTLFVGEAEHIAKTNKIEPIIALFNFSDSALTVTVYLLFDRSSEAEIRRANQCYDQLWSAARHRGGYVHRVPNTRMGNIDSGSDFWRIAGRIKRALDPDGVIAPGRYVYDGEL